MINRLHARGRVRVWSVVITIFGDAVAPHGGDAPLQVLQSITERLRIEPGALRTAMSRLASEGWVERRRDGRTSHYRLAEQGRNAFDEATQRIYAAGPPDWDGQWSVVLGTGSMSSEAASQLEELGFRSHGAGTWFRADIAGAPQMRELPEGILLVSGHSRALPANVHELWGGEVIAAAFEKFLESVLPLWRALDDGAALEGLDAIAARTLLIHDWRRIVLKAPILPAVLLPPGWPVEKARALTRRIYTRLTGPSESWLSENGLPALRDPAGFSNRFGIVPRIRREDVRM